MASRNMARVCPNAVALGPAVLPDHRLAFTRFTPKLNGGSADVLAAPGLCVWGVAYQIRNQCRVALDLREGNGIIYIRSNIGISLPDEQQAEAITYKVIKPVLPEIRPPENYIYAVSEGAAEYNLPGDYQGFLIALWSELKQPTAFREGLMVMGYVDGHDLHVNPADVSPDVDEVTIHYHKHQARVLLVVNDTIPRNTCLVGVALRDALLLPKGLYGAVVRLEEY